MYRALWKKSFVESRWLLLGSMFVMFAFNWLRIWLISQLPTKQFEKIIFLVPRRWVEDLSPVPLDQIVSLPGRIAMAYDDPLPVLIVTVWAIGRGSDAVSGELGRGTMEMLLAQPVTRTSVLWTQALMTLLGGVCLAAAAVLGTYVGLAANTMEEPVSAAIVVPAACNILSLVVCLAGISTLVSSFDRYRWRTIGLMGAFYVVQMIFKFVGRTAKNWNWLEYATIFTAFEPQVITWQREHAWTLAYVNQKQQIVLGGLGYDAILVGMGLLAYLAATVVFCRRDLPAPL